tara:strand:+ start:11849 stop:12907 length:1059 start_codon:yes stop_codon:yes gene_type:complete
MSQELIVIEEGKELSFFEEGGTELALSFVKAHLADYVADLTTDKGRKLHASNAAKIGKSRKMIDDLGKRIRKGTLATEKERAISFGDFQAEFRKPLTDWEDEQLELQRVENERLAELKRIDDERVEAIQARLGNLQTFGVVTHPDGSRMSKVALETQLLNWEEINIIEDDYQEFTEVARDISKSVSDTLTAAIEEATAYESDQAELEQLRKDKLARDTAALALTASVEELRKIKLGQDKAASALAKADLIPKEPESQNTAITATEEKPVQVIAEKEIVEPASRVPAKNVSNDPVEDKTGAIFSTEPTIEEKKAIYKGIHSKIVELTGLSHDDSKALLVNIIGNKIDNLRIVY